MAITHMYMAITYMYSIVHVCVVLHTWNYCTEGGRARELLSAVAHSDISHDCHMTNTLH